MKIRNFALACGALTVISISVLGILPLQASTVTVIGNPGTNGAVDGGPGDDATAATLPNTDPTNDATAVGGAGGTGATGAGGGGGNANATAATTTPDGFGNGWATATGNGGTGGSGFTAGGTGGGATSNAIMIGVPNASVLSNAKGGDGGASTSGMEETAAMQPPSARHCRSAIRGLGHSDRRQWRPGGAFGLWRQWWLGDSFK